MQDFCRILSSWDFKVYHNILAMCDLLQYESTHTHHTHIHHTHTHAHHINCTTNMLRTITSKLLSHTNDP